MLARGQHRRHLLRGLFVGPVHESRRNDLDPRVILENRVEARLPDAIAGRSIDAAHLIDVALALQLIEQPLGADLGVGHLVAGHDIRFRSADGLVRRNDDDPLVGCLLDDAVERLFVRRVYDDCIDAGRNQGAQVRDLLGRLRFAIGQNDLRNQARCERFGFDRADEFLAPAIADMSIGDPDYELLSGARAADGRRRPHCREHGKRRNSASVSHFILPHWSLLQPKCRNLCNRAPATLCCRSLRINGLSCLQAVR